MHYLLRALSLTAVMAFGVPAIAQESKTIYFNTERVKKKRQAPGKNSIAVNLLSFLDGYTAIQYERPVNDWISLSGSLGFTFYSRMQNLGEQVHEDNYQRNPRFSYEIDEDYSDMAFRKATPGFYLSFSPRFYGKSGAMSGPFLAPMLEYRVYNFDVRTPAGGVFHSDDVPSTSESVVLRSISTVPERFRSIDLTACVGSHHQLRNHMVIGYYMGIGARHFKTTRIDLGLQDRTGDNYEYVYEMHTYSGTRFLLNIGFFLGGWL